MGFKDLLHFLLGVVLGAVAFAALFILFELLVFDLAGGETLSEIRGKRGVLMVLTILLAILFIRVTIRWFRSARRAKGHGLALVTLTAVVLAGIYFADLYRYSAYDKKIWVRSDVKPFRMAAGLFADGELLGKTKAEITRLLGESKEKWDYEKSALSVITYDLTDDWTMLLFFEGDLLKTIEIRRPSLMT